MTRTRPSRQVHARVLGLVIRHLRGALSQDDLSRMSGISRSSISRIEGGEIMLSMHDVECLAFPLSGRGDVVETFRLIVEMTQRIYQDAAQVLQVDQAEQVDDVLLEKEVRAAYDRYRHGESQPQPPRSPAQPSPA